MSICAICHDDLHNGQKSMRLPVVILFTEIVSVNG